MQCSISARNRSILRSRKAAAMLCCIMEFAIRGYEFWFRDETGSDIAKIELPYGPSPLGVVGGTPYQDINSGVDIQYIGQLVDTVSTSSLEK